MNIAEYNRKTLANHNFIKEKFPSLTHSLILEEASPPFSSKINIWVVCLFISTFIIWSALTPIDEISIGAGQIIPVQLVKSVQHLEGGIIRDIYVKEGDFVKENQILIHLDEKATISDLSQAISRSVAIQIQIERLKAFGTGTSPQFDKFPQEYQQLINDQKKVYESQLKKLENEKLVLLKQTDQQKTQLLIYQEKEKGILRQLETLREQRDVNKLLADQKLRARTVYLNYEGEVRKIEKDIEEAKNQQSQAKQAISESENKLLEIETKTRNEALTEMGKLSSELVQVDDMMNKLQDKVERLVIQAPISGIIKDFKYQTVNGIINPGVEIMQIVPIGSLEAESKILPNQIGNVHPGQEVLIKISAFDYGRYGGIPGTVRSISATTFQDEKGTPYYKVFIKLNKNHVGNDLKKHLITPGMTFQANIKTGEKTLLQYFGKTISNTISDSFKER